MKEFKIRASACGKIMGVKGLGLTGQSYCEQWLKEQLYGRKYEFTSKYTDKGNICEDESIDFVAQQLGYGLIIKNEDHFEDDFMTGTPDIILSDHLIDVKNSWDCFTFPLFDKDIKNKDYYWQAQVYMSLTGMHTYKLIYVLSDTPENLIEKEAYWWCKNNGYDDIEEDIYDKFKKKLTYPGIDDKLKIKDFVITRNSEDIEKIKARVLECREYIKSIMP